MARKYGKIENTRAAADRPVRALGQGVRQRKAETHQEDARQSHFQQDRPGVEPQLLERSRRIRVRGPLATGETRDPRSRRLR